MASNVLYPPILDSYMPAFRASDGECRIYFSLSKYNSQSDFKNLHVSIVKQKNNARVVNNKKNDGGEGRYRSTGIILNVNYNRDYSQSNLYYFTLKNDDLLSGFEVGEIYKVQVRLSGAIYNGAQTTEGQSSQLNKNASLFSEWSTVCIIKAIGDMNVKVGILNNGNPINNESNSTIETATLSYSTLDIFGSVEFVKGGLKAEDNEILYMYNIKLFDVLENKYVEESGKQYAGEVLNINEFRYIFKTELKDTKEYRLDFYFTTNNYYEYSCSYNFVVELGTAEKCSIEIKTVESDNLNILDSTISLEQEEGRIGLKLVGENPVSTNICIRRSDSKSNFSIQEDIKIFPIISTIPSSIPIIQDYTIESGVFYKYGVQTINESNERSELNINTIPAMRDFEYSYLLGEDNKQLKLKYNNIMNSYKIQLMESKIDPIGGTYPIITRNAALNYRIFPIVGTISFSMDENHLFCDRSILYENGGEDLQIKPRKFKPAGDDQHNENTDIDSPKFLEEYENKPTYQGSVTGDIQEQYDYIYERAFREKVLEFLHDGKPKLFKSPTEGNIIVRLTDINCTPNKTLDRMIYDFTSNGNEIAEATLENYIKYNFLTIGEINTNLSKEKVKIGQISTTFEMGKNILRSIYDKYDGHGENIGGQLRTLLRVYNVRITIEDIPLRYNNLIGNKILLKGASEIAILAPQRILDLDSRIFFEKNDWASSEGNTGISFIDGEDDRPEGTIGTVKAVIDFLYELEEKPQTGKKILSKKSKKGMGQLFGHYSSGYSISGEISRRYYFESDNIFRRLNIIHSIEIQGSPGLVFSIKDDKDPSGLEPEHYWHEINDTGILVFYEIEDIKEIKFYGIRNKLTGAVDTIKEGTTEPVSADMCITYQYNSVSGRYDTSSREKGESE